MKKFLSDHTGHQIDATLNRVRHVQGGSKCVLMGRGAKTPIFTDTGASVKSQPTSLSTTIEFTKSYSTDEIDKGDIILLSNSTNSENDGMYFVCGRFPPDLNNTQVEVTGHLTIGGTADIEIYTNVLCLDKDGRAYNMAHTDQSGTLDSDIAYELGYKHDMEGKTPGKIVGLHIGDYNQYGSSSSVENDHPLEIYRYDGLGSALFYVNGQGDVFNKGKLTTDKQIKAKQGIVVTGQMESDTIKVKGDIKGEVEKNDQLKFRLKNTSTGDSAFSSMGVGWGFTSDQLEMYCFNPSNTFSEPYLARSGGINAGKHLHKGLNIVTQSTNADAAIRFYTNNNKFRLIITKDGNVGIGTKNPDSKLHVKGAITQQSMSADPPDPDPGNSVQWISDGTGSGDAGDIMVKINVGGTIKTTTLVDYSAI